MKKTLLVFIALFGFSLTVLAQTVPEQAYVPIDMLNTAVTFLSGMPVVGPYVAFIMTALFLISNSATVLATAWVSLGKLLVGTLNLVGAGASADKVELFMKGIAPWLKYFSSYNVKKPLQLPWKNDAAVPPQAPIA